MSWLEQSHFIALKDNSLPLAESYVAAVRLGAKLLRRPLSNRLSEGTTSTTHSGGVVSQIIGTNLTQEAKLVLGFWYEATNCLRGDDNVVLDIALRTANVTFRAVNEQNSTTWKKSLWHNSDL